MDNLRRRRRERSRGLRHAWFSRVGVGELEPAGEILNEVKDLRVRTNEGDSGAPGEIRTPDLQLRRLPLYPAELRARAQPLEFTTFACGHQIW